MNRKEALSGHPSESLFEEFQRLHQRLDEQFRAQFSRSLPLAEELVGTSIFDSAFVFGELKVGKGCWIGPYTIIDGSGGLEIGDHCTISTGVHIYTHDNVKQTLTAGKHPIEREKVTIGACTYVGPQSIITKGIHIGDHCLIASNSFVNKSIPPCSIAAGNPAKIIGRVEISGSEVKYVYDQG
jgi:acetyltransferase-like isoleucine patch superfamily enzyme